jgi:hypothetical protein
MMVVMTTTTTTTTTTAIIAIPPLPPPLRRPLLLLPRLAGNRRYLRFPSNIPAAMMVMTTTWKKRLGIMQ